MGGIHSGKAQRDQLHSVESAASFLGGVAVSTVRAWLSQGKLTRVKIGRLTRVRESELLGLISPASVGRDSRLKRDGAEGACHDLHKLTRSSGERHFNDGRN